MKNRKNSVAERFLLFQLLNDKISLGIFPKFVKIQVIYFNNIWKAFVILRVFPSNYNSFRIKNLSISKNFGGFYLKLDGSIEFDEVSIESNGR